MSGARTMSGRGDGDLLHRQGSTPTEFYHGTSLEAILAIQDTGFRVDLAGSNAGAALDSGVYITTTLEKALNYAKGKPANPNPAAGGVIQLQVDLGRCYTVRSNDRAERMGWAERGYDSAWAAAGIIGEREEHCVRDPARIRVTRVVLGNTREAQRLGYEVRDGRLVASHLPQDPTQQAAAKLRRERAAAQAEAAAAREAADRSAREAQEAQRRAEVAQQTLNAMAQPGYGGDQKISVVVLDPPRAPAPAPPAPAPGMPRSVSHNDCSCCFNV